jgi:predicted RNase H-like nuclease
LPYKLLAGVEPCARGWLVVGGRLAGITLTPVEPEVLPTFVDVLDAKPAYSVIALHSPVGLNDSGDFYRTCDLEARRLLGWPRATSVLPALTRAALSAPSYDAARKTSETTTPQSWSRRRWSAEVDAEMQPYWQRTVYEVNPELGFYGLNGDAPLRYGKRTATGEDERRALLESKIPGIGRVLDAPRVGIRRWQTLDAAVNLWTARRIMSRAVSRIPEDPEWDEHGLRMEIIR